MQKNSQPFFSITTATYNREKTLPRVFKSLQSQTFKNFEWIIGDDGSTDNTEQLIKKFQKMADFPIKYVKAEHAGKHAIYKRIYLLCTGIWLTFLDSDDAFYSKKTLMDLKKEIEKLPKNRIFTGVGGCFINQYDKIFPTFTGKYYDVNKDSFFKFLTSQPGLLNIFGASKAQFKIKTELKQVEDCPAYPEIVQKAKGVLKSQEYNIRVFNKPMYRYFMFNQDSVTVHEKKNATNWYYYIDMANLFFENKLDKKYPQYIRSLLNNLAKNDYKIKGLKQTLEALKDKKMKYYFLYTLFIRKYLKYIFLIDRNPTKVKYYLFGIKLYTHKLKNKKGASI